MADAAYDDDDDDDDDAPASTSALPRKKAAAAGTTIVSAAAAAATRPRPKKSRQAKTTPPPPPSVVGDSGAGVGRNTLPPAATAINGNVKIAINQEQLRRALLGKNTTIDYDAVRHSSFAECFVHRILRRSVSAVFDEACQEWILHAIFEKYNGVCLCGHTKNIQHCVLVNRLNGNVVVVGSTCIKHFKSNQEIVNEVASVFSCLENIRANPWGAQTSKELLDLVVRMNVISKESAKKVMDIGHGRKSDAQLHLVMYQHLAILNHFKRDHPEHCGMPMELRYSKRETNTRGTFFFGCQNYDFRTRDPLDRNWEKVETWESAGKPDRAVKQGQEYSAKLAAEKAEKAAERAVEQAELAEQISASARLAKAFEDRLVVEKNALEEHQRKRKREDDEYLADRAARDAVHAIKLARYDGEEARMRQRLRSGEF